MISIKTRHINPIFRGLDLYIRYGHPILGQRERLIQHCRYIRRTIEEAVNAEAYTHNEALNAVVLETKLSGKDDVPMLVTALIAVRKSNLYFESSFHNELLNAQNFLVATGYDG